MSKSGRVDGHRPVVPQQPNLNDVEAQKLRQQNKLSPADQARLATQAGFQRLGAHKNRRGKSVGDTGESYLAPDEEVDPDDWNQETLERAQTNLSLATAQFEEIAEEGGDIGEAVVGGSFLPTDGDIDRMQLLADRDPPPPVEFEDVSTDVKRFFHIEFGEGTPTGHKLLAAGLLVAGEGESVEVVEGATNEAKLAAGVKKVAEKGNQAVTEAQMMNKGINQQVNYNRTLIVKR